MATESSGVSDKFTATPTGNPADAKPPESPARNGIIRETWFKDNLGNRLVERTPVHGALPPTKYVGLKPSEVMLPADVQIAMGMGVRSKLLEFPVLGDDPVMAYLNYDAAYAKALETFRQNVAAEVEGIRAQIAVRNAQRAALAKPAPGATPQLVQGPAVTGPVAPTATGTIVAQSVAMSDAVVIPPVAPAAPVVRTLVRKPPKALGNAGAPTPSRTPNTKPGGRRRG